MHRLYDRIATGYYVVATAFLLVLAVVLLLGAVWQAATALLFGAAMFALIALGLFQWLSSRIAPPAADADASIDTREPADEPGDEPPDGAAPPA